MNELLMIRVFGDRLIKNVYFETGLTLEKILSGNTVLLDSKISIRLLEETISENSEFSTVV